MGSGSASNFDASLYYAPSTESDEVIYNRAANALNGAKFLRLWNGDPADLSGDKSASAIDQGLVNILAFYTRDPLQIQRLWLASPQGKRSKTQDRSDYRERTINRAFDREVPQLDFTGLRDQLRKLNGQTPPTGSSPSIEAALPVVAASTFAGRVPPPRPWHVESMIPGRTVTLLGGDGGTGKSLVALQLAFATASRLPWLGSSVRPGACLFLTAEDDLDEVHRRVVDIANAAGFGLQGLHGLTVSSLAGLDALLAVPERRTGVLEPTRLFGALWAFAAAHRPALIVLDTLADLFGGEENNRAQARQFISMLRTLALEFDLAVVLLAHPSLTGLNTGSGTSGSTGWNNSVRSRLYLKRDETDPNVRVLSTMKANYGATGQELRLRWQSGVFVEVGRTSNEPAHRAAAEQAADELFLQLLAEFTSQGRTVSPHASSRMNAIRGKLRRMSGRKSPLGMEQFQDLGGCRAIMGTKRDAELLINAMRDRCQHHVWGQDDYIHNARDTGYRSHHLKFEFQAKGARAVHNGRRVEVQIRTNLQHSWATAVEAIGLFRGEELKSGRGSKEWLRLFALMSAEFAEAESCDPPKGLPDHAARLRELKELDGELGAVQVLENLSTAFFWSMDAIQDNANKPNYYLIQFENSTRNVSVTPLYKGSRAFKELESAESPDNLSGHDSANIVLVEADKVHTLKRAYPNYFGDVQLFKMQLSALLGGRSVQEHQIALQSRAIPTPKERADPSWLYRRSRLWEEPKPKTKKKKNRRR